jgi:hypothetical protein
MFHRRDRSQDEPTITLLRMIGSPFSPDTIRDVREDTAVFECAQKNKIGLLYLDTLKSHRALDKLWPEYEKMMDLHAKQRLTAHRIAAFLNRENAHYAIVKSLMPFPFVPNDVDVIIFDPPETFDGLIHSAAANGYDVIGIADLETMLHDARGEEHKDPRHKDIYDIDLYRDFGAINIVYLDKEKFRPYTVEFPIFDEPATVLTRSAELVVVLIHSIFPEQIFTSHLYVTTLHYLSAMEEEEIREFIELVKQNHVASSCGAVLSIISDLHEEAFGFSPEAIDEILAELGTNTAERTQFKKRGYRTPQQYRFSTIMRLLFEKMREQKARKSILSQCIRSLRPKVMVYVISVVLHRRRRDTY